MTAFAADRVTTENRRVVPVDGVRNGLHLVAVTEQTRCLCRPLELLAYLESGRQVPHPRLRIPAQQGLKKIAVALDQVRSPSPSRADRKIDFDGRESRDSPALRIAA